MIAIEKTIKTEYPIRPSFKEIVNLIKHKFSILVHEYKFGLKQIALDIKDAPLKTYETKI